VILSTISQLSLKEEEIGIHKHSMDANAEKTARNGKGNYSYKWPHEKLAQKRELRRKKT
jgi:hypothetical protein